MSKTLLLICFMAWVALSVVDPSQRIKDIVANDECASKTLEIFKPQIQEKMEALKQNSEDLKAKAELLALVEKANGCQINKKVEPVLNDVIEGAGMAFLLASNCFKDIGAVLLIFDSIVQDPSDWKNDIIVLIFVALLGRQGYADCEQFIHFVI
eukprot:GHVR01184693.1.p1 GENE.GHVR01184693.1~~GHVR01184693.1.p1  ORF type:complete len:154 (-),score=12.26 GHVR01184693.1:89-550(-)